MQTQHIHRPSAQPLLLGTPQYHRLHQRCILHQHNPTSGRRITLVGRQCSNIHAHRIQSQGHFAHRLHHVRMHQSPHRCRQSTHLSQRKHRPNVIIRQHHTDQTRIRRQQGLKMSHIQLTISIHSAQHQINHPRSAYACNGTNTHGCSIADAITRGHPVTPFNRE